MAKSSRPILCVDVVSRPCLDGERIVDIVSGWGQTSSCG